MACVQALGAVLSGGGQEVDGRWTKARWGRARAACGQEQGQLCGMGTMGGGCGRRVPGRRWGERGLRAWEVGGRPAPRPIGPWPWLAWRDSGRGRMGPPHAGPQWGSVLAEEGRGRLAWRPTFPPSAPGWPEAWVPGGGAAGPGSPGNPRLRGLEGRQQLDGGGTGARDPGRVGKDEEGGGGAAVTGVVVMCIVGAGGMRGGGELGMMGFGSSAGAARVKSGAPSPRHPTSH